jgi:tetratricopeptide (TPR) repeat protein
MTGARLGNFLCRTSRMREGLAYLRAAWESAERTLPRDDAEQRPTIEEMYGWELARFGHLEEGEQLLADATAAWRRNHDGTDYMLSALERLAYLRVDRGRFDSAQALLDEADAIRRKLKDYTTYPNGNGVAHAHLAIARGDWSAAESAIQGLRVPVGTPGGISPQSLERDVLLAELALRRGAPARAAELATETLARIRSSRSAQVARTFEVRALAIQGEGLLASGSATAALPVLLGAVRAGREIFDAGTSVTVAGAELALARCLSRLARPGEARAAYAAAAEILGRHGAVDPRLRTSAEDVRRALRT